MVARKCCTINQSLEELLCLTTRFCRDFYGVFNLLRHERCLGDVFTRLRKTSLASIADTRDSDPPFAPWFITDERPETRIIIREVFAAGHSDRNLPPAWPTHTIVHSLLDKGPREGGLNARSPHAGGALHRRAFHTSVQSACDCARCVRAEILAALLVAMGSHNVLRARVRIALFAAHAAAEKAPRWLGIAPFFSLPFELHCPIHQVCCA
jgi:hypothetical protein